MPRMVGTTRLHVSASVFAQEHRHEKSWALLLGCAISLFAATSAPDVEAALSGLLAGLADTALLQAMEFPPKSGRFRSRQQIAERTPIAMTHTSASFHG